MTRQPRWAVRRRATRVGGLQPNTRYWVKVHACNGVDSCGPWSADHDVWTRDTTAMRPGPVEGLQITGHGDRTLDVGWTAPAGTIDRYQVQQRDYHNDDPWPVGSTEVTTTRHTIRGLYNGRRYEVRVRACHQACGAWVSTFGTPRTTPGRPPQPSAQPLDRALLFTWANPGNGGASITKYHLQWGIVEFTALGSTVITTGVRATTVDPTTVPRESFNTTVSQLANGDRLINGQRYWVRVQAENSEGTGPWSDSAWGTPEMPSGPIAPPDQVGPLSFSAVTRTSFTVSWNPPSPGGAIITGYDVLRRQSGSTWPAESAADWETETSKTSSGLAANTTYVVKVRACNHPVGTTPKRCGAWSNDGRVTTTDVAPPPKVEGLTLEPGDRKLTASWDAVNTTRHTHSLNIDYQVQRRVSGVGTWPDDQDVVAGILTGDTEAPIPNLTNGTEYQVRVRARLDAGNLRSPGFIVGAWSDHLTATPGLPQLNAPTNLDVIARPDGTARLMWTGNPLKTTYVIQYKPLSISSWHTYSIGPGTAFGPGRVYPIDLANIHEDQGLDDRHKAYEFRVKAVQHQDNPTHQPSAFSEHVIIMDTPITVAHGRLSGTSPGEGKITLKWDLDETAVLGHSNVGGSYTVRHQEADGDHTSLGWTAERYISTKETDEEDLFDTDHDGTRDTIDGLSPGKVYSVQLLYKTRAGVTAYSGVYAYVWTSHHAATNGERVATVPLSQRVVSRTHLFRICSATFPEAKRADWRNLIEYAFEVWERSTNNWGHEDNILTTTYAGELCADYSVFIERIVSRILDHSLPALLNQLDLSLLEYVESLIMSFKTTGIDGSTLTEVQQEDLRLNEVIMDDDLSYDPLGVLRQAGIFSEIADEVGYEWCWDDQRALACAYTQGYGPETTTDIFFLRSQFEQESLRIPGVVSTNELRKVHLNLKACTDDEYRSYKTAYHEAGHALGIGGGQGPRQVVRSHASIPYSVMGISGSRVAYCCMPTAYDVMVINALYRGPPG